MDTNAIGKVVDGEDKVRVIYREEKERTDKRDTLLQGDNTKKKWLNE